MKGWYYYEHDKCRWDKTPYQLQWLGKLLEAEQQASIAPKLSSSTKSRVEMMVS